MNIVVGLSVNCLISDNNWLYKAYQRGLLKRLQENKNTVSTKSNIQQQRCLLLLMILILSSLMYVAVFPDIANANAAFATAFAAAFATTAAAVVASCCRCLCCRQPHKTLG